VLKLSVEHPICKIYLAYSIIVVELKFMVLNVIVADVLFPCRHKDNKVQRMISICFQHTGKCSRN